MAGLDAGRSAPDAFAVVGREIYLQLPNGMGRTKLTNAYFDSKLKTVSTARNWRTVLKLLEMWAGSVWWIDSRLPRRVQWDKKAYPWALKPLVLWRNITWDVAPGWYKADLRLLTSD